MRKSWQVIFRMAGRICDTLGRRQTTLPGLEPLNERWNECRAASRRLGLVNPQEHKSSYQRLRSRLQQQLRLFRGQLDRSLDEMETDERRTLPSITEVALELVTLEEEFESVSIDLRKNLIAVTTAEIELDGMDLGQYEIVLDIAKLNQPSCYTIYSLADNQSASNGSVCHPHVSGDLLCEGEGRVAIKAALCEGRLLDFFQVVNHILQTYNPESAFVRIENWDGIGCQGCGDLVHEDEWSGCGECQDRFCSGCITACALCENYCCNECLTDCHDCSRSYCSACMNTCARCYEPRCEGCLDEEGNCEPCQSVLEEESQNEDEETETTETSEESASRTAPTEVHTVGVGQAGLVAGSGTDGDRRVWDRSE